MSIGTVPNRTAIPSPAGSTWLTAEAFLERYANQHAELVLGLVRELPMPPHKQQGYLCTLMGHLLATHIIAHDLGRVFGNDTAVVLRRNPDTVYGPDVCYVSYARLPKGKLTAGPLEVPPELVAEVRSPGDTWTDVFAKITDYLRAGVAVVIVQDGESETASVYQPNTVQATLTVADTLTLPELLPGFSVPVQRFFC